MACGLQASTNLLLILIPQITGAGIFLGQQSWVSQQAQAICPPVEVWTSSVMEQQYSPPLSYLSFVSAWQNFNGLHRVCLWQPNASREVWQLKIVEWRERKTKTNNQKTTTNLHTNKHQKINAWALYCWVAPKYELADLGGVQQGQNHLPVWDAINH